MGRRKIIRDEQLLEHAREEFLKNGAFGSTKEIARKSGVSEATLYQRYPTKAALFLAAMVPQQVDINAIINSFTKETDPRRVLTEIGLRILAYFRTLIPVVMHLITNPSISMADVNAHFKGKPVVELSEALAAHMNEANSRGLVKVDNPMAAASLFVSAIHSLAVFELMEIHGGKNMDHAVKQFTEALWSGIAPASRTRKTAQHKKAMRKH
ncbi:MAG: TetR/AcrR family transcriptional regulator [Nitrospirae bacterium]|nr:TetR/AcrR family transcriptional regulator [Nitrospirota bacterium]